MAHQLQGNEPNYCEHATVHSVILVSIIKDHSSH